MVLVRERQLELIPFIYSQMPFGLDSQIPSSCESAAKSTQRTARHADCVPPIHGCLHSVLRLIDASIHLFGFSAQWWVRHRRISARSRMTQAHATAAWKLDAMMDGYCDLNCDLRDPNAGLLL